MAIKKVFKIKDEILENEVEVFGSCGYYESNYLRLIDVDTFAQNCIENVAEQKNEDTFQVNKDLLEENIKSSIEDISKSLVAEILASAISDIDDDEEMELIK